MEYRADGPVACVEVHPGEIIKLPAWMLDPVACTGMGMGEPQASLSALVALHDTLVDRTTGRARSMVVDDLKAKTLVPILKENIAAEATVYTDEAGQYRHLARDFAEHEFVRHASGEWGRGPVHTNTIEGYFRIFKRGMKGVYQHCAKKHLHRYAAEFEFRYNNRTANGVDDRGRAAIAIRGVQGKRLKYANPVL